MEIDYCECVGRMLCADGRFRQPVSVWFAWHIPQNHARGDHMFRRTLLRSSGAVCLAGLAATREAHANTMADIKARGTLVIGVEAAYVPFCFSKDGKVIG